VTARERSWTDAVVAAVGLGVLAGAGLVFVVLTTNGQVSSAYGLAATLGLAAVVLRLAPAAAGPAYWLRVAAATGVGLAAAGTVAFAIAFAMLAGY
jgi:hypothetical protein